MFNKKTIMFTALVTVIPVISFAGDIGTGLDTIGSWVGKIGSIIIGLTVVAFFWGLFQFVFNESKREDGKYLMGWSLLAIFIMSSLWGIISFMQTTTGTSAGPVVNPTSLLPKYKNN